MPFKPDRNPLKIQERNLTVIREKTKVSLLVSYCFVVKEKTRQEEPLVNAKIFKFSFSLLYLLYYIYKHQLRAQLYFR
ncbi:hypothetical protein TDIS_2128 [Thermosulfurimonas dismutans]|uniref:Uncharacterized protein n=1 Tax=Thermosulfurimonas dismutans TaxID=999894 RepID=A0A179D139_9BACT|nr:hypothetical protein TDIS_2128 [Thermosulfurimonas dismutans]